MCRRAINFVLIQSHGIVGLPHASKFFWNLVRVIIDHRLVNALSELLIWVLYVRLFNNYWWASSHFVTASAVLSSKSRGAF